jgi:hypothetical protein
MLIVQIKFKSVKPDMVPDSWEAEVGGSLESRSLRTAWAT